MLFQLLAAIVHRLKVVIEVSMLRHFDTRDLHIIKEIIAKVAKLEPFLTQKLR
ncbi:hypothetical protein D3C76_985990 [compost metagenome]